MNGMKKVLIEEIETLKASTYTLFDGAEHGSNEQTFYENLIVVLVSLKNYLAEEA